MDNIPNGNGRVGCRRASTTTTISTDAFGRLRVSNPFTLFDVQNRYKESEKFYSNVLVNGTVTYSSSESTVFLNVTSESNSYAARESKLVFAYQPGKSLLVMNTFVMNPPRTNLVQRVGYFGSDNGYFIQLKDSSLYIVERSNVTGTVTNNEVIQSDWNGDRLDGTGPSKLTANLQAAQIFFSDIEWLGVGSVRTGLIIDGTFIVCHTFNHANIISSSYMTTACLPLRYEIMNTGTTSGSSRLKQICSTVISEGGYDPKEHLFCAIGPATGKTLTSTTVIPLCTLRLASGRLDAVAFLKQVNLAVETNNDLAQWQLILNGDLTGATYAASSGGSTNVQVDTAATAISGGRVIEAGFIQTGSVNTSLPSSVFDTQIGRNSFTQTSDTLTVCVGALSMNPKVFWSLTWTEQLV